jgi:(Z)-2-((N-methylformamido)methylene)-5-hydroxybutyrolactone dehydrogenase
MKRYQNYIDGEWVAPASGREIESENPYTREIWATIARSGPEDVDRAVGAAYAAFKDGPWSKLSASARGKLLWRMGDLLEANVERLALLETSDNGRTLSDMRGIVLYLADYFRYFAGLADKVEGAVPPLEKADYFNYTRHEPYGVVAAITPWNSPLLLVVWKLAPGLAAGNTFVLKPHEVASAGTLELATLFTEAGFPKGVVNVVTGTGLEVGEPLVTHPKVRKIAFTGGDLAGRAIYQSAARDFKPVTLELGGKSPNIVFADANLENAAKGSVLGMFNTSGQACIACSRVLVQDRIYDEFVAKLIAHTSAARLGDPTDPATEMGPMGCASHFEKVMGYLDLAREEGARVLLGGGASQRPGLENGYFIEPTILGDVNNSMRIAREEIFGPVMSVIRFKDEEEAIRIANDSAYGLGAGVWTENMRTAIRVSNQLEAGSVYVNSYRVVSYMSPFGGYKHSGLGRENGVDAIKEYLQVKSVWFSLNETAPPPFGKPYG